MTARKFIFIIHIQLTKGYYVMHYMRVMNLAVEHHCHILNAHIRLAVIGVNFSCFIAPFFSLTRTHTHAHTHLTTDSPVSIRLVMIGCSQVQDCQGLFVGLWAVFGSQHIETHISAELLCKSLLRESVGR